MPSTRKFCPGPFWSNFWSILVLAVPSALASRESILLEVRLIRRLCAPRAVQCRGLGAAAAVAAAVAAAAANG
jgi:hypothetical protein